MPSAFCSGWKEQTQIVRTAWVCKWQFSQIVWVQCCLWWWKVMVWNFMSNSHKVMIALIVILPWNHSHGDFSAISWIYIVFKCKRLETVLVMHLEKLPSVFGGHLMPHALPCIKPMCVGQFQSVGLALVTSSSSVHYLGNAPNLGIYPTLSIQKGSGKMNYYELFLECCHVKFCFVVVCFSLFFRVGVPSFSCLLFGLLIFC
jgi:hypothetical protein